MGTGTCKVLIFRQRMNPCESNKKSREKKTVVYDLTKHPNYHTNADEFLEKVNKIGDCACDTLNLVNIFTHELAGKKNVPIANKDVKMIRKIERYIRKFSSILEEYFERRFNLIPKYPEDYEDDDYDEDE
jgi:hypothetical protein